MKTSDDIIATLRQAKPEIEGRFGVRSMAIFGSHARGESREDSDVDILVDVDPAIGLEFVSLADMLQELLGAKVDLISRRSVQPRNWKYIEPDLIYV
ncbi:MAG: nucleotidyltransferase [Lentisphaerales bacterium]|nr:MAG: nucleotidyltransferase [Lentisphaerales bacterium]